MTDPNGHPELGEPPHPDGTPDPVNHRRFWGRHRTRLLAGIGTAVLLIGAGTTAVLIAGGGHASTASSRHHTSAPSSGRSLTSASAPTTMPATGASSAPGSSTGVPPAAATPAGSARPTPGRTSTAGGSGGGSTGGGVGTGGQAHPAPPPVRSSPRVAPQPSTPRPPAPTQRSSPPPPYQAHWVSVAEPAAFQGHPVGSYSSTLARNCADGSDLSACGTSGVQWGGGCSDLVYYGDVPATAPVGWAVWEFAAGQCKFAMSVGNPGGS